MVEVEQDSRIWLANTGPQPIRIKQNEVVAMAECVTAGPGASPRDGQNDEVVAISKCVTAGDEVNGLVERAAPHLTDRECQHLRMAMAARRHLFATGKGDLGQTDIVQHQIHTGTQPAIKQRVRRYPAARHEEERHAGYKDYTGQQQCVEQSDRPGEKEGWNDAVLYRLPTTQSGYESRLLPAPTH